MDAGIRNIIPFLLFAFIMNGMERENEARLVAERVASSDLRLRACRIYDDFQDFNPSKVHPNLLQKKCPRLFDYRPFCHRDIKYPEMPDDSMLQRAITRFVEFTYKENTDEELVKLAKMPKECSRIVQLTGLAYHFNVVPYFSTEEQCLYFDQNYPNTTALRGDGSDIDFAQCIKENIQANKDLKTSFQLLRELSARKMALEKEKNSQEKLNPELQKITKERSNSGSSYQRSLQKRNQMSALMEQQYQICLMPIGDCSAMVIALFQALNRDDNLQRCVTSFKTKVDSCFPTKEKQPIVPRIIIQPALGKEKAQEALNRIYALFRYTKGLDIQPGYTAKINDLIWVRQGDGRFADEEHNEFWELPEKVYYTKILTDRDPKETNYYLCYPPGHLLEGKEIV